MTVILDGAKGDKNVYANALKDAKREAMKRDCTVYLYKCRDDLRIGPVIEDVAGYLAKCYPGGRTIVNEKLYNIINGQVTP